MVNKIGIFFNYVPTNLKLKKKNLNNYNIEHHRKSLNIYGYFKNKIHKNYE